MSKATIKATKTLTVVFGGKAGQGIKESGKFWAQILQSLGKDVVVHLDYPSLIRGGYNFAQVSACDSKINDVHEHIDVLVAFTADTIKMHKDSIDKDTIIIYNKDAFSVDRSNAYGITLAEAFFTNSAFIGALCFLFNIKPEEAMPVFKVRVEENKVSFNTGYSKLQIVMNKKVGPFSLERKATPKAVKLLNGNEAVGYGAAAAGLKWYYAYPMTPATGLLQFFIDNGKELGVQAYQPENEISAAAMTVGSAFAGKPAMTGSSGGGFALKEETVSLAGMSETPFVVLMAQRQGPSTGVPTYTSQGDLNYVLASGHGEFSRIVLAPGDVTQCYEMGARALALAWKYQVPVILLTDQLLSEDFESVDFSKIKVEKIKSNLFSSPGKYERYKITKNGISPLSFPGTPGQVVKGTSYEHDEYGITTEDAKAIQAMQDKRFRKDEAIKSEFIKNPGFVYYGSKKPKTLFVSWGSTKKTVLEAIKRMKGEVSLLQITCMSPFNAKAILPILKKASKVIDVELNHDGQLASLIRRETGFVITKKILKYDSRPLGVEELLKKIKA